MIFDSCFIGAYTAKRASSPHVAELQTTSSFCRPNLQSILRTQCDWGSHMPSSCWLGVDHQSAWSFLHSPEWWWGGDTPAVSSQANKQHSLLGACAVAVPFWIQFFSSFWFPSYFGHSVVVHSEIPCLTIPSDSFLLQNHAFCAPLQAAHRLHGASLDTQPYKQQQTIKHHALHHALHHQTSSNIGYHGWSHFGLPQMGWPHRSLQRKRRPPNKGNL